MTAASAQTVVQTFFDNVLNRQDVDASTQILSPDHVAHFAGMPSHMDLTALQEVARQYFAGFPNFHLVPHEVIAEGDRVAVRWTWSGTHQGAFLGVPATGKQVEGAGMGIYHVVDGRIAEQWVSEDMNLLMQQIAQAQP